MYYLLKRTSVDQFDIGDRVMVLADFNGITAGDKGVVVEIYGNIGGHRGVMIKWEPCEKCAPGEDCGRRPQRDGFGEEELGYLAIGTNKHPEEIAVTVTFAPYGRTNQKP